MKRTNIYLQEAQSAALEAMAMRQGLSRAELVRRLIDRELVGSDSADLESDLAAIRESAGVLDGQVPDLERGADDRARYLDRLWEA